LGLLLAVVVHSAGIQDETGARLVMEKVKGRMPRLQVIFADAGYAGILSLYVRMALGCVLEIVRRPQEAQGFVLLPKRWMVERTFGWFNLYRRLSKDYEQLTETSEAIVLATMVHLMVRRLARNGQPRRWKRKPV
jgi:putative transposase